MKASCLFSKILNYLSVSPELKDILFTTAVIASAGFVGVWLKDSSNSYLIQLMCILCVALTARFTKGYLCSFIVSVTGAVIAEYSVTYPDFRFALSDERSILLFCLMLILSLIVNTASSQDKTIKCIEEELDRKNMSGNLLRAISHDIRTPLTVVSGSAFAIIENRDRIDEFQLMELIGDIRDEAEKLRFMVENILTVSKMSEETGRISRQSVSAEEIIREAVRKFRATRDVIVETDVPCIDTMISVNPLLIEHVILNIMENSVIHGCAEMVSVCLEKHGGNAVFRITDNGKSISEDVIHKVNSGIPISGGNTKGSRDSNMGIGLSVCKTIITVHGGVFSADKLKNGGTEILFTIPADTDRLKGFERLYEY